MRQYRSETKLQGWRALAVYEDGSECLLFLGRSTTQVRSGYAAAFAELLTDEERDRVRSISLQCWDGAPDEGRWVAKGTLNIPVRGAAAPAGTAAETSPRLRLFRKAAAPAAGPAATGEDPACVASSA
jgi:hypothetical protein